MDQQKLKELRVRSQILSGQLQNKQKEHLLLQNQLLSHKQLLEQREGQRQVQIQKGQALVLYVAQLQRKIDELVQKQSGQQPPEQILILQHQMLKETQERWDTEQQEFSNLLSFLKKLETRDNKPQTLLKYLQLKSTELSNLKSQIGALDSGEGKCDRKWHHLHQENKLLKERILQIKRQVQRQNQSFNLLYGNYLQRAKESGRRLVQIASSQPGSRQKIAATTLVQHMAKSQVEMQAISDENQSLHQQMSQLIDQLDLIKHQHLKFQEFWQVSSGNSNITKIKQRIQQLRDAAIQSDSVESTSLVKLNSLQDNLRQRLRVKGESLSYMGNRISSSIYGGIQSILDRQFCQSFLKQLFAKLQEKRSVLREQNSKLEEQILKGNKEITQLKEKLGSLQALLKV